MFLKATGQCKEGIVRGYLTPHYTDSSLASQGGGGTTNCEVQRKGKESGEDREEEKNTEDDRPNARARHIKRRLTGKQPCSSNPNQTNMQIDGNTAVKEENTVEFMHAGAAGASQESTNTSSQGDERGGEGPISRLVPW